MKRLFFSFASAVALAGVVSCGARTELFAPDGEGEGAVDASFDAPLDSAVGCTPGAVTLSAAEPEVMFVLDRSGSMKTAFSGNQSRWQVLTSALAATLPPVDGTMAIGALLFPSGSSMNDCSLPGTASLTPALDHVQPLLAILESTSPGGSTPTASAIDVASALMLEVRAATTARALVLATDGAPNCNPALDVSTCTCATGGNCQRDPDQCLDDTRTVAQIATVAAQGIPTYVIGIANAGDGVFSSVLDAMAVAGGRPLTGGSTSYYPALSQSDLETAISTIRDQVGACTYLTTSVPSASGSITLTFNGQTLPYDPSGASGWSWSSKSNGEILLLGSTCATVAGSSNGALVANVTCDATSGADASGDDAADGADAADADYVRDAVGDLGD
jgi:von Willebrand factor type A domain